MSEYEPRFEIEKSKDQWEGWDTSAMLPADVPRTDTGELDSDQSHKFSSPGFRKKQGGQVVVSKAEYVSAEMIFVGYHTKGVVKKEPGKLLPTYRRTFIPEGWQLATYTELTKGGIPKGSDQYQAVFLVQKPEA